MTKILIIEHDLNTLESLRQYFQNFDLYDPIFLDSNTHSKEEILDIISQDKIDIIIIDFILKDLRMPSKTNMCKRIREITKMPLIVTSFNNSVSHKVRAFKNGADDYLTKPYHFDELHARMKALLRRLETKEMTFGSLHIDSKKRVVRLKNECLELTNTEFDILLFLIENRLQPISRDRIAHTINAIHEDTGLRSIDTHIRNLRNKLGDSAKSPKYIQSVWGIGYKFCV